jgi:3'-phosphoadenosine 5'-phosphosulfate sulfotransferase (PAPS reductase)/FAD synthetase
MNEPVLTVEDERVWARWRRECLMWSRTACHENRVEAAKRATIDMHDCCPSAYVAFSGGKDSAVLLHLVASLIPGVRAMSVKDDMDFPGEVEYVRDMARKAGAILDVLYPEFSLQQWLVDNAVRFDVDDDLHSRGTEFSDKAFYQVVEQYRIAHGSPGVYLGLRKYESHSRMMNRTKRGVMYQKQSGEVVCQPLCDWEGRDVYAYAFKHGIEFLPLYRCVRLAKSPDKIRKSWWIMNIASIGGWTWLKTYYPSLAKKLWQMFPESRARM